MSGFVITRAWVLDLMGRAELPGEITLPADQMRALLAAALNGLRPVAVFGRPPEVIDLVLRRPH